MRESWREEEKKRGTRESEARQLKEWERRGRVERVRGRRAKGQSHGSITVAVTDCKSQLNPLRWYVVITPSLSLHHITAHAYALATASISETHR